MGICGIFIGGLLSLLGSNIILKILNNLLTATGYTFRLIIDIKYIALALFFMILNIYLSVLIPSVKASTASVIQGIKSNKDIKRKRNSIFEKLFPIEGRMALKNLKRNKNKYRLITILLVICITSYISVSTYISYEKEAINLVNPYDVDAELRTELNSSIDYKKILNNYTLETGDEVEYMEYKQSGLCVLVKPKEAIVAKEYKNKTESEISIQLIGLDDKTYHKYVNKTNANDGDFILYNNVAHLEGEYELVVSYEPMFNTNNLEFSIIGTDIDFDNNITTDYIIDDESLKGNFVLTDNIVEGYNDIKVMGHPTIFMKMDTYNKIDKKVNEYRSQNPNLQTKWIHGNDGIITKVKCGNIIGLSNYIERIKEEQNLKNLEVSYYSLYYQGKIVYTNILQFMLNIIMLIVIIIGGTSAINVINASLCEREQEFKILNSLGATRKNINKILIYECVYMFVKSSIISVILSIPILNKIIEQAESVIVQQNKMFIPFTNIGLFFVVLFILSLCITIYSTRFIKNVGEKE